MRFVDGVGFVLDSGRALDSENGPTLLAPLFREKDENYLGGPQIAYGYDGTIDETYARPRGEQEDFDGDRAAFDRWYETSRPFSAEECREIADFMIALWNRWADEAAR